MSVTSIAPLLPKFDIPKDARARPRAAPDSGEPRQDARFSNRWHPPAGVFASEHWRV